MTKEPHEIKASNYKWENALTCGTVDELANRPENKKGILRNFARLLVVGDVGGVSRILGIGIHFSFGNPFSLHWTWWTWEEHLTRRTFFPWRRWILLPIDYGASRHNSFDWLGQDKGTPPSSARLLVVGDVGGVSRIFGVNVPEFFTLGDPRTSSTWRPPRRPCRISRR
jgi:hypothetical protein